MQIVYISNKPEILNPTLIQVKSFMPFINAVLIVSPGKFKDAFINPGFESFIIVTEDQIGLQGLPFPLLNKSHQNYQIRALLADYQHLADEFILSDDDYRPIRQIDSIRFKHGDQYCSFYFYHLENWMAHTSSFDQCLQHTYVILHYYGYPTLAFSSHMPQIYNKAIWQEAIEFFKEAGSKFPLCEWSIYFNYAHRHYPQKFTEPEIHQTMCWPQLPGIWPDYLQPKTYSFENFYPENYLNSGIFHDLTATPDINQAERSNLEKLIRLRKVEIKEIFPPPIQNWKSKGLRRRLTNWFIKFLLKTDHERFLNDRKRLLKLLNSNSKN